MKDRINAIDREIESLLDKISSANETLMKYINSRVSELDDEKNTIESELTKKADRKTPDVGEISGYLDHWEEMSVSDKISVVDCLIESIHASKNNIEITWKI